MVNISEIYANQLQSENFTHEQEYPSVYGNNVRWKPGREAKCCAFSSDNKNFAWSTGSGFKVISFKRGDSNTSSNAINARIIDCGNEVKALEFASNFTLREKNIPSTSLLAVGLAGGGIKIWNVESGVLVFHLSDHQRCVTGLTFAPCGNPFLISCSLDKTLKVWDLDDDGNMTLTMKQHNFAINDCAFSPVNKHLLASVGNGKQVFVWKFENKRSCRVIHKLRGHQNDVVSCSWSPDGALLATASHDTTVIVWDPHLNQPCFYLCHQNPLPSPIYAGGANGSWVTSVAFSSDGLKVATVCEDNKVRVWKPWSDESAIMEATLSKSGYQCRFSPDSRTVAVGKENGSVSILTDLSCEVLPLTYLSRVAVRKVHSSVTVSNLHLPKPIQRFLLYQPTSV